MGIAERQHVVPPTERAAFLVSGTTHRQANIARCGRSLRLYRLAAEPANAYDENAVQVLYGGTIHVGYISSKMSSLYREAVDRYENAGEQLWVHGMVHEDDTGLYVELWCPWSDEL
jgi:hypothetical protein